VIATHEMSGGLAALGGTFLLLALQFREELIAIA
jgi:hypothetical protein